MWQSTRPTIGARGEPRPRVQHLPSLASALSSSPRPSATHAGATGAVRSNARSRGSRARALPTRRSSVVPSGSSSRQRDADPGRPQTRLVRTRARAAPGESAVDRDRRDGANAVALRLGRNRRIVHVKNLYVAGRAGNALDHSHGLVAGRATGGEDLDFALSTHDQTSYQRRAYTLYLGTRSRG